jgi:hypothetical protein
MREHTQDAAAVISFKHPPAQPEGRLSLLRALTPQNRALQQNDECKEKDLLSELAYLAREGAS